MLVFFLCFVVFCDDCALFGGWQEADPVAHTALPLADFLFPEYRVGDRCVRPGLGQWAVDDGSVDGWSVDAGQWTG